VTDPDLGTGHVPLPGTPLVAAEGIRATFTAWRHALRAENVREAPIRDTGITGVPGTSYHGTVHIGLIARVYDAVPDDADSSQTPTPGTPARPGHRASRARGSRAAGLRGTLGTGVRPGHVTLASSPWCAPTPREMAGTTR
jgi:hypothetical protein